LLLRNSGTLGFGVAISLYGIAIFKSAWLSEDAFITFRTVDNFVSGLGLTWNPAERVQAYTHPLWMFLLAAFYFITGEIYYTSLLCCAVVSVAAVMIFAHWVAASMWAAALGVFALTNSKAFVDYSTSGLENPLTFLLLALFATFYIRPQARIGSIPLIYLIVGVGLFNRMDLALIFGPGIMWILWQERSWRSLVSGLVGIAPLAAWVIFSLIYYGFPFPNTAYAKLGTGVEPEELVGRGINYLAQSSRNDPLTTLVIVLGGVVPLVRRDWRYCALIAGGGLYLSYVVWIGGDYMSGRFLAAPFLLAIIALCAQCSFLDWRARIGTGIVICAVGLSGPFTPLLSGADYGDGQRSAEILDTRGFEYPHTGLLPALAKDDGADYPDHWWAIRGRKLREGDLDPRFANGMGEGAFIEITNEGDGVVAAWSNIGMSGFYAGPRVHIVDVIALSEPLLARLPAKYDPHTGAGHHGRIMPGGYLQTLVNGENEIADRNLARYYDRLKMVIADPIWNWERLREIWRFNTGYYDSLIDREFYRNPTPLERALSDSRWRPGRPEVFINLGKQLFAIGRKNEAIDALNRALANNHRSFKNAYTVAAVLKGNGLVAQSRETYRHAIELAPAYIVELEQAERHPEVLEVLKRLALAHAEYWGEDSQVEVYRIFSKILNGPYEGVKGDLYGQIGHFMNQIGKNQESREAYAKAIAVEGK